MSRRALPFVVATAVGILSGVYIFRPIIDQELQRNTPIQTTSTSAVSDARSKDEEKNAKS